MDLAAERRYETLRARLVDLHYYQPLSVESTQLVEKILGDLVKSVESFQTLKQRHLELTNGKNNNNQQGIQAQLARLEADNNELHTRLIDAQEEQEKLLVSTQLDARSLRDQIEDHKVLQAAETQRWRQVMRENEVLKQKVRELVQINKLENQVGPPPTIDGDLMADFKRASAACHKDEEASARMITLSEELQSAQNRVSALERCKVELERKLANAPAQVLANKSRTEDTEEKEKLVKKTTQLESQVDFINTQYEQLKVQHRALQKECGGRNDETKELLASKQELEQKILQLEEDLKRQQRGALSTMTQTQAQNFETLKLQEEQKVQLANLKQVKERLEGEIRYYKEDKEAAEEYRRQEIEALQTRLRDEIRDKTVSTGELEARMHELQIELERTTLSLQTTEQRKNDVETRLQIMECSGNQTAKVAAELKNDAARAAMNEQMATTKIAELEARVKFLTESLETLSGDKKAMADFVEERRLFALEKEKEARETSLEKNGLSTQLAAFEVTKQGLMDDIAQQKMQRTHLERELQFLKETEVPQLRKLTQSLQKDLAASEEVAKVVQEQHRELSLDYDKVSNELFSLRVGKREGEEEMLLEQQEAKGRGQLLEQRVADLERELREAHRLEGEVKKLQEQDREKGLDLVAEKESLITQVRNFETEMARIHCRVSDLSAAKENLHQECRVEGSRVAEKDTQLGVVSAQLAESQALCETERTRAQELQEEVGRLQDLLAQEQRQYRRLEEVREVQDVTEAKDQALVSELRKKLYELEAEKAHCVAEVRVMCSQEEHVKAQNAEMVQKNADMEKQILQLTSLLSALEQTREQLVSQIRETQETVDRERDLRQDVINAAAAQSGDVTSLQEQIEALKEALTNVDAERDELQNETDRKSEEVVRVSNQLREELAAMEKCHAALEDARRSNDLQTKELVSREERLQRLQAQEEMLTEHHAQAHADLERAARERQGIEDDLRNMIAENQILNERLHAMQGMNETVSSKHEDVVREKERHLATLQSTVMERDDVVEMYRTSVETTQRQQAQIETLLNEKEDLIEALHEAQLRSQTYEKDHEATKSECRESQLDILTLQKQTSQLARECEERTWKSEQVAQEHMRVSQELVAAQAARRECDTRRNQLERDFARIQSQLEAEQRRSGQLVAEKSEAEQYALEEQKRSRQLEELLAQQRSAGSSSDAQDVHNTVEHQYSVIAQMDIDLRRLREENEALKK